MQPGDPGKKPRNNEGSINFRPSPNFKHMKKYLKSKFEEMNCVENKNTQQEKTIQIQNELLETKVKKNAEQEKVIKTQNDEIKVKKNLEPDKVTKVQIQPEEEKPPPVVKQSKTPPPSTATAAATATATAAIHPPLPPHPPPPDPIPKIKQEVIDEGYLQYINAENAVTDMHLYMASENQDTTKVPGAERTMCRNFIRGNCKKGAQCIFAHELIVSQLPGVYTFCRNFQNRQCTFARCKFVHATVFEKEYFYRTGYLPPHTIAHLNALPPQPQPPPPPTQPPPPPPPPPEDPIYPEMAQQAYYGYPTMDTMGPSTSSMGMECTSLPPYMLQASMLSGENMAYSTGPPTSTVTSGSLKRGWTPPLTTEEHCYTTEVDYGVGEPLPKRCKHCDTNEFRYQYYKNKVENVISETEEVNKKMTQINVKNERLCTVLMTLFKPQTAAPPPAPTLSAFTTTLDDKDKNLLDQMNLFMSANNRMSFNAEEEALKSLLGHNSSFQNIVAKLLMNATGQTPQ